MSNPDQLIESICATPIGADEPPSWFKVGVTWRQFLGFRGKDGIIRSVEAGVSDEFSYAYHDVTEIKFREENRGDHGIGWYDVLASSTLIASINERSVHEIYYQIPYGVEAG